MGQTRQPWLTGQSQEGHTPRGSLQAAALLAATLAEPSKVLVTTGRSSCSFRKKNKADTGLSVPMRCPAAEKRSPTPNQTEDKYFKRLNWFLLFTNEHFR